MHVLWCMLIMIVKYTCVYDQFGVLGVRNSDFAIGLPWGWPHVKLNDSELLEALQELKMCPCPPSCMCQL